MSVTTPNTAYSNAAKNWQLLDDVCAAGDDAIKARRTQYLPMPNPRDGSEQNRERYDQYLARAVFYNATGRTLRGLTGLAFAKAPVVELPQTLEYLTQDADGAGVSIEQQAKKALSQTLKLGRHALFVDYPKTDGESSIADKAAGQVRARIVSVKAEQIINWRTQRVGGTVKLALVIIAEQKEVADEFTSEFTTQYRVLSLDNGVYRVRVFDAEGNATNEDYTPTDGQGRAWNEIPLVFIGAENNDSDIDESPLLDIAKINLAHYRNSADYEDSVYFNGQAQGFISGLTEEWRDHLENQGVYIGSRTVLLLPEGGSFGYAQAAPNTLVREAMADKEAQMVALGARLLERDSVNKTATQVNSEDGIAHSVLSQCCANVSAAYTKALTWCARFENASDQLSFDLNREFSTKCIDAQALTALVGAWQQGAIPQSQLWRNLRASDVIDASVSDDELAGELEAEAPDLALDGNQ